MLQSKSRTWVEVDLGKIKHNVRYVQSLIGSTKIMAVVKANAYGHGDIQISKMLQDEMGIDFFAVSSIDEAIVLRQNGIHEKILILGYTPEEHFHYLKEYHIIQCILSYAYALKLDAFAQQQGIVLEGHVKCDTGMGRIGIPCLIGDYHIDEVKACYGLKHLHVTGIFSHFSVSDSWTKASDVEYTNRQIRQFDQVLADLKAQGIHPGITHLQNSYGCLNYYDLHYDYARPGIILLGNVSNDADLTRIKYDLRPSLTWKANVTMIKTIPRGTSISYGRNFVAPCEMKVASLSVGYADGLNRNASNQHACVLIQGKRCEIIGNICMDQCIVDVSGIDAVQEGDIVTIIGQDGDAVLKADEFSRAANTINNETFTLISKRVPRFYKE